MKSYILLLLIFVLTAFSTTKQLPESSEETLMISVVFYVTDISTFKLCLESLSSALQNAPDIRAEIIVVNQLPSHSKNLAVLKRFAFFPELVISTILDNDDIDLGALCLGDYVLVLHDSIEFLPPYTILTEFLANIGDNDNLILAPLQMKPDGRIANRGFGFSLFPPSQFYPLPRYNNFFILPDLEDDRLVVPSPECFFLKKTTFLAFFNHTRANAYKDALLLHYDRCLLYLSDFGGAFRFVSTVTCNSNSEDIIYPPLSFFTPLSEDWEDFLSNNSFQSYLPKVPPVPPQKKEDDYYENFRKMYNAINKFTSPSPGTDDDQQSDSSDESIDIDTPVFNGTHLNVFFECNPTTMLSLSEFLLHLYLDPRFDVLLIPLNLKQCVSSLQDIPFQFGYPLRTIWLSDITEHPEISGLSLLIGSVTEFHTLLEYRKNVFPLFTISFENELFHFAPPLLSTDSKERIGVDATLLTTLPFSSNFDYLYPPYTLSSELLTSLFYPEVFDFLYLFIIDSDVEQTWQDLLTAFISQFGPSTQRNVMLLLAVPDNIFMNGIQQDIDLFLESTNTTLPIYFLADFSSYNTLKLSALSAVNSVVFTSCRFSSLLYESLFFEKTVLLPEQCLSPEVASLFERQLLPYTLDSPLGDFFWTLYSNKNNNFILSDSHEQILGKIGITTYLDNFFQVFTNEEFQSIYQQHMDAIALSEKNMDIFDHICKEENLIIIHKTKL